MRNATKAESAIMCSERVRFSCFINDTCRVLHVMKLNLTQQMYHEQLPTNKFMALFTFQNVLISHIFKPFWLS